MAIRPHRSPVRVASIVAAVVMSATWVTSVASPPVADAAPTVGPGASACPSSDGVTVVIDFGPLGGGVQTRCAADSPDTGFEALRQAGVAYQEPVRFPGMVCRIAGLPTDAGCYQAPPADAYWTYWHATRGGQWVYSDLGPGNRRPPAGSFEGWAFFRRSDSQMTVRPPGAGTTTTTTTTAPSPPTTGRTPPSDGGGGGTTPTPPGTPTTPGTPGGTGGTKPGDPAASPAPTSADSGSTTTTGDSAGASTTSTGDPEPVKGGTAAGAGSASSGDGGAAGSSPDGGTSGTVDLSDGGGSTGSPLPVIAVVAVLVLLGGWRMFVLARHRRAEASTGP